jgi:hypothetical protein
MKKHITAFLIALFLIFVGSAAHAALVTENFTGTIASADDGNPFGVTTTDTFTWSATYDLDYLSEYGQINIGENSDMQFSVTVGSQTFSEEEDIMYTWGGGPLLLFDTDSDNIIGISFIVIEDYAFRSIGEAFYIYAGSAGNQELGLGIGDDANLLVTGTFDFTPVPVPAAIWLLGSGLAGLAGLRRRAQKA